MGRKHTWPQNDWMASHCVGNAIRHQKDALSWRHLNLYEYMNILRAIEILEQAKRQIDSGQRWASTSISIY